MSDAIDEATRHHWCVPFDIPMKVSAGDEHDVLIPTAVWDHGDVLGISEEDRRVLLALEFTMGEMVEPEDRIVPDVTELADETGLGEQAFRDTLAGLRQRGYVSASRRWRATERLPDAYSTHPFRHLTGIFARTLIREGWDAALAAAKAKREDMAAMAATHAEALEQEAARAAQPTDPEVLEYLHGRYVHMDIDTGALMLEVSAYIEVEGTEISLEHDDPAVPLVCEEGCPYGYKIGHRCLCVDPIGFIAGRIEPPSGGRGGSFSVYDGEKRIATMRVGVKNEDGSVHFPYDDPWSTGAR